MLPTIPETAASKKEWRYHPGDDATALTIFLLRVVWVLMGKLFIIRQLPVEWERSIVDTITGFLGRPVRKEPWTLGFNHRGEACTEQPVVFVDFPMPAFPSRKNNAGKDAQSKYLHFPTRTASLAQRWNEGNSCVVPAVGT